MKKKKYLLGIIFMIGILLLGSNFYHENKVVTQKKNVKADYYEEVHGGYYVSNGFTIAKEDEQGNPMDVTMRLVSPKEDVYYPLRQEVLRSIDSEYYTDYTETELTASEISTFLTNEQKNALAAIHKLGDLETVLGHDHFYCAEGDIVENNGDTYYYPAVCYITLPTVYRVEELEVPEGYSKKKVYVPGKIDITYDFPNLGYDSPLTPDAEIRMVGMRLSPMTNGYMMEYGKVEKEDLIGLNPVTVARLWKQYGIEEICQAEVLEQSPVDRIPAQKIGNDEGMDFYNRGNGCPSTLVNEKGEVKLDVTLSVDDKVTVTSDIDQKLEFKVSVRNIGSLDAYDNTVRAKLPEGFKYVEGSASDGGTYQDGMVTWKVDLLEEGNNINLTYKAYAPKGINVNDSFIGEAVVVNDSIEGSYVEANKTYVKLSLNNPKTYAPVGIIVIVLVLSGLGLISVLKPKKNN